MIGWSNRKGESWRDLLPDWFVLCAGCSTYFSRLSRVVIRSSSLVHRPEANAERPTNEDVPKVGTEIVFGHFVHRETCVCGRVCCLASGKWEVGSGKRIVERLSVNGLAFSSVSLVVQQAPGGQSHRESERKSFI